MSVNELEEILPYVAGNAFSWAELLDFRSRRLTGECSVHQAIYDLLRENNLPAVTNSARNSRSRTSARLESIFISGYRRKVFGVSLRKQRRANSSSKLVRVRGLPALRRLRSADTVSARSLTSFSKTPDRKPTVAKMPHIENGKLCASQRTPVGE